MPQMDALTEWALRGGVSRSGVPEFTKDERRRYMATDIPCEGCGAAIGDRCSSARFCQVRMAAATELARVGKLQSHGPAMRTTVCPDCQRMDFAKHKFACANTSHQCRKRLSDGTQCKFAVLPGGTLCASHAAQQPGTKPGRKPALSDAQVADAIRRHDVGETWPMIATSLGVSQSSLMARVKKMRDR